MNWRLPTGYSPGMRGWSCKCCASASSLAWLGLAPFQGIPPIPAALFPLRQLSLGAGGKQVLKPRVMEPSEGWGCTVGAQKVHPPTHTAAPLTSISSHSSVGAWRKPLCRWCWHAHFHLAAGLQPGEKTLWWGNSPMPTFLLSPPLLQSWAAASTSILSPTMCMRRRGVCMAKPCSLPQKSPATHSPANFPFWCLPGGRLDQLLFSSQHRQELGQLKPAQPGAP